MWSWDSNREGKAKPNLFVDFQLWMLRIQIRQYLVINFGGDFAGERTDQPSKLDISNIGSQMRRYVNAMHNRFQGYLEGHRLFDVHVFNPFSG